MPALMHMINGIKKKHANKENIGLHDLDAIMPYKCIMGDTDRSELGAITRNAISELGSMARGGSSAAGSGTDKGEQPLDKKGSAVLNFFGWVVQRALHQMVPKHFKHIVSHLTKPASNK